MATAKHTLTIQQQSTNKASNRIQNIQVEKDAHYRLLDKKGDIAKNPTTKVVDGDLWVYFEENVTQIPDVIFHGYEEFLPLINNPEAVATLAHITETTTAQTLASATGGYLGKALLGTALIGGVAAAAGGGGKESGDTPTPTPTTANITIDNIPTINQAVSNGTVTVTGTLDTENAINTQVNIEINGNKYSAVINGGIWSVSIGGKDLAYAQGSQPITATIIASNGTQSVSAQTQANYMVDTLAPTANIILNDILGDNLLNKADMDNAEIPVTGQINELADNTIDNVKLNINGTSYTATVNGNIFHANIKTADLAKGTVINAVATITDNAGNTQTTSANKVYTIDTTPPQITLTLDDITADNKLDATEVANGGNTVITGCVVGEFHQGDVVTLKVGVQNFTIQVETDGKFSANIPTILLVNSQNITASITATDQAGNQSTQTTTKSYTVETAPVVQAGDLSISLDAITTDNLINVTEANSQITITGMVTGVDRLSTGQTVDLSLNGVTLQSNITVDSNGQFRTTVSGEQLAHSQNYTLTAHATGDNNAVATSSKQYTVSADVAAKIDITTISDGFDTTLNKADEMVRITGKAVFEGDYANTGDYTTKTNAQLVRQVEVKIGDQTYTAGVRQGEFYIDIKQSELAKLQGETLSYTFKAEPWFFDAGLFGDAEPVVFANSYAEVQASSVVINSDHTATANGVTTVNTTEASTSAVSGMVSGSAKAGDTIEIMVNDNTYRTTVNTDKTFSVEVLNSDLAAGDAISAVLNTTDLVGNAITLSDTEMLAVARNSVADFVSYNNPHHSDDYFVKQLDVTNSIPSNEDPAEYNLSAYGKVPFGGTQDGSTPVITYYFGDSTSYNAHRLEIYGDSARTILHENTVANYPESIKEIIRNSYTKIASYTNVEFREVNTYEAADVKLYYMDFTEAETLAFAYYDGNIAWNAANTNMPEAEKIYTALHEITHTFGMEHSSDGLTGSRASEESAEFTYMSYRSYVNGEAFKYLGDLRIYDLAVLHFHLGVNQTARAGDDIYTFQDYDMFSSDAGRYIWDGGGVDTFDASTETVGVTVDLTPGSWIYAGQKSDNFLVEAQTVHTGYLANADFYYDTYTVSDYTKGQAYIGYGTQIENLIGSDYADTLTGNNANNAIYGGAGDDFINGGAGDDYLDGGTGADTLTGGAGDDIYIVDNTQDLVIEAANEGMDIVYSSVDYTLTSNVEHLALIGTTAKNATGNELDNTLIANNIGNTLNGGAGDDTLVGGLGADTLTGGAGDDLFIFNTALNGTIDTITDFMQAGNDTLVLASDVFTSLSQGMNNVLDFISYDNTTGVLSYDSDTASGIADAIAFANIGTGINLQDSHFTII